MFESRLISINSLTVLNMKQVLRRWRECNPNLMVDSNDESIHHLHKLLDALHKLSGISDTIFDLVDSREAVCLISLFVCL